MIPDLSILVARVGNIHVPLPRYQTHGASGMDMHAALPAPVTIAPGERILVPTGLAFSIPSKFEAQIRPRSGLAATHGITVLNSPGTIDSDYRGEVKILLINLGQAAVTIAPLDRIAQMVIAPVAQAGLFLVDLLDLTQRGAGGYGSTGSE